jgi:membrane-bound ClpP family serine protease
MIRWRGELWQAFSSQEIGEGKAVRVLKRQGLRVEVAPAEIQK